MSSRRCHLLLLNLCAAALPATALRSGSSGPGTSNAPPIASTPIIPITGDDWTFIGGEWLSASPSPYAYSGGAGGENIKGSWNAPAAKSIAGDTNEFGVHPVQDDVHLAVYTVKPFKDFSASFDLTHTAQVRGRCQAAASTILIDIAGPPRPAPKTPLAGHCRRASTACHAVRVRFPCSWPRAFSCCGRRTLRIIT